MPNQADLLAFATIVANQGISKYSATKSIVTLIKATVLEKPNAVVVAIGIIMAGMVVVALCWQP